MQDQRQWHKINGLMLFKTRQANSAETPENISMDLSSTKVSRLVPGYIARHILANIVPLPGKFMYDDLIPDRKLQDTIPSSVEEKDREAFLSFVSQMITWLPEERKSARELMEHPFLKL